MGSGKDVAGRIVTELSTIKGSLVRLTHNKAVAKGVVPGAYSTNKFGENNNVAIADVPEIINPTGHDWDWFTSGAQTVDIVSDDATDDEGNTGAITLEIEGLDSNYERATDTVTLDGLTSVSSTQTYTIVFRAVVRSAGSNGANAGTLTCTGSTDTGETAFVIEAGNNQTEMAVFAVEAGKEAYLHNIKPRMIRVNNSGVVSLYAKPDGEVWQLKDKFDISQNGSTQTLMIYDPPKKFAAKTLIKTVVTYVSADNSRVGCSFDMTSEDIES